MSLMFFERDQNPVELKDLIRIKDGGGSRHEIRHKLSEPLCEVQNLIVRDLTNAELLDRIIQKHVGDEED